RVGDDLPDRRLVFHHQDRFISAAHGARVTLTRTLRRLFATRQIEPENGPAPEHTLNLHPASVLRDDAIDRGQSETVSLAHIFGREDRLENVAQRLAVHTDSGIRNREAKILPEPRLWLPARVRQVHLHELRANDQLPAVRHRVARIAHQVHDDL